MLTKLGQRGYSVREVPGTYDRDEAESDRTRDTGSDPDMIKAKRAEEQKSQSGCR